MLTIVSLKSPSGRATDAVDTVNQNVFSRLVSSGVRFLEAGAFLGKVRLLRREHPQYALGIGGVSEMFLLPFLRKETKYVIAWHTVLRKTKAWPVRNWLFKKSAWVLAVSQFSADSVSRYFPGKRVEVVLNGVDLDKFSSELADKGYLEGRYGIKFNQPIVLFVGTIEARKRPDVFLQIARRIDLTTFVIVGRDKEPKLISSLSGISNAKWIPFMPREDVAKMMASSDIFLFPSINEPCAAVIPEALASGLPVLLSKSGGNQELIIDGREGFLIPVGDSELDEFAKKLQELIDQPALRKEFSKKARAHCENELNWGKVSKRYYDAFSI